jgi:hypothetical protein
MSKRDPENSGAVFLSKPTHSTNISLTPKKERIAMGSTYGKYHVARCLIDVP